MRIPHVSFLHRIPCAIASRYDDLNPCGSMTRVPQHGLCMPQEFRCSGLRRKAAMSTFR